MNQPSAVAPTPKPEEAFGAGANLPQPLASIGAVLFDLDGTLIDTAGEIADAVNDTLAELGLPVVTEADVRTWVGHGTQSLMVRASAQVQGLSEQALRESGQLPHIMAVFARHYLARCGTRSQLYPHVREALSALRAQGVRLAVVTNKESAYTQVILDAHGLTPVFDRVVSGDTFPIRKPDPTGVLACLEGFGVSREQALFVGDSSVDVATARNAGVAVWALPYGYNLGQPIEASQPDRVVPDLSVFLNRG
jgi:phosphoglycolate phosphatase